MQKNAAIQEIQKFVILLNGDQIPFNPYSAFLWLTFDDEKLCFN